MSVMVVTLKETGLKKALNVYSMMAVNELPPEELTEGVTLNDPGCEVVILEPKEKLVKVLVTESFSITVKEWDSHNPKYKIPDFKKANTKKKPKKRAPAKKKVVAKKVVAKKVVAKKAVVKKKVARKRAK